MDCDGVHHVSSLLVSRVGNGKGIEEIRHRPHHPCHNVKLQRSVLAV